MRFFDHTPMAIATVDRAGIVVRANARYAKLAQGLSGDGAAAKSIFRAVNARDRGTLIAAINQAAEGQGDIAPVEVMLEGAKERWGQFFVTTVESDERDAEAAIVYMLETTERRALENQINQSQKMEMVGQLAGGIAHDFNNVLSAIMMANDFLLNAHKPTDPSFQDIMQIKQNATRAATLVRQLLAFSRRQTLRPQVLDLGDALSDLTMLLRRLIGEKVKLDLVHGRDLWPVKVDVSQFEQVDRQSRGQCARRHARGRQAHGEDRQCHGRGCRAARLQGHAGGRLCADRHHRYRHRHPRRHQGQDLRAVLLDQGSRQGHRAWALDGLRHRQADRRLRLCRLRRRQGHLVPHLPAAASRRAGGPCRAAGGQRRGKEAASRAEAGARRPHRAGHHPAGRGRRGPALAERARASLARLQRDRGLQRRRGDRGAGGRRTARSISWSPTS